LPSVPPICSRMARLIDCAHRLPLPSLREGERQMEWMRSETLKGWKAFIRTPTGS
jgi:hypothetical protein